MSEIDKELFKRIIRLSEHVFDTGQNRESVLEILESLVKTNPSLANTIIRFIKS